jgi:Cu-Zn family superoxide dismutase
LEAARYRQSTDRIAHIIQVAITRHFLYFQNSNTVNQKLKTMKAYRLSIIAFCLGMVMACSPAKKEENQEDMPVEESAVQLTAMATMNSASGSSVTGTATFTQLDAMTVRMTLEIQGLTPGEHALHLHQNGDCSAPDASSAGGHWNPGGVDHGKRGEGQFHAGDVINLVADADGNVSWSQDIMGWTIGGDESSNILNKGVIIHEKLDDFKTQPTGAAGGRVACGVIVEAAL